MRIMDVRRGRDLPEQGIFGDGRLLPGIFFVCPGDVYGEELIGGHVMKDLPFSRVPLDDRRIDLPGHTQPEMRLTELGRQVSPVRVVIIHLLFAVVVIDADNRAQSIDIFFIPFEFYLQEMI